MADPSDVSVENVAERCQSIATLKRLMRDRMRQFEGLSGMRFINYLSTSVSDIIDRIAELGANHIIVVFTGVDYEYDPMASGNYSIFVTVECAQPYSDDFDEAPLDVRRQAVKKALDKYVIGGNCTTMVRSDNDREVSNELAVCEIVVEALDQ